MKPWNDPQVAERLHQDWTTEPIAIQDAQRLAAVAVSLGNSFLDYGCGTGRMAAYFSPTQYLGYDQETAMLEVACREYPSHDFKHELEPEDQADVVICNSVVQYNAPAQWQRLMGDILMRARKVALIETYDGTHLSKEGGSGSTVWVYSPDSYIEICRVFGAKSTRRVLLSSGDPALALYIASKIG